MDASAITGSVVGVAGVALAGYTQWSNTRLQRQLAAERSTHERQLAHEARVYESRRDIYVETLVQLHRLEMVMQFTEPIIGPMPDPPELPDDTETGLLRLAQLRAFGSPDVYASVLAFNKKWTTFRAAVGTLRALRGQHADDADAWMRVQGEREEASRCLDHVADLINAELTTP